jgi:transposase, IS5 family
MQAIESKAQPSPPEPTMRQERTVQATIFEVFARLPMAWSPKKSVLRQTISAINSETWEAINRALLAIAKQDKVESGATVRIDSTVTAALMHQPSDSALLWGRCAGHDAAACAKPRRCRERRRYRGARRRLAKKRARAIEYSLGKDTRRQLYHELIAATRATQAALQEAVKGLADLAGIAAERWRARVDHYQPLIERILAQSERRVLDGLAVPAGENLVSQFEPHAYIIVKGAGDVRYGHKLNLATGKSGLILDVVVEAGNPVDAERFLPMLDRQIACCGVAPRQIAADGGYASLDNLNAAKARRARCRLP